MAPKKLYATIKQKKKKLCLIIKKNTYNGVNVEKVLRDTPIVGAGYVRQCVRRSCLATLVGAGVAGHLEDGAAGAKIRQV